MKIFTFVLILLLSGCSITQKGDGASFSHFEMSTSAGMYRSYISDTWKMKGTDCFRLTIDKGHFGSKWLPSVDISFRDDEGNYAKLRVSKSKQPSNSDFELITKVDGEKFTSVLRPNVDYGEDVFLYISYPDDESLLIKSHNVVLNKRIGFTPTKLKLHSASSLSTISILDSAVCKKII